MLTVEVGGDAKRNRVDEPKTGEEAEAQTQGGHS